MRVIDPAHGSYGTDKSSLLGWEELGSQDPKQQLPHGPGFRPSVALPSMFLVGEEAMFPLHASGPQGKPQQSVEPSTFRKADLV